MPQIGEMDLPFLDIHAPGFPGDPFTAIDAAREKHPWLARIKVGYFVHGYHAVRDLAGLDDYLVPDFGTVVEELGLSDTPWADFQRKVLTAMTGEKHWRVRMSTGDTFLPRNMKRHIGLIREQAAAMLDEWAPLGAFDFVEFAATYPVSVMCRLVGASTEEMPKLRAAFEAQSRVGSRDPDLIPTLLAGFDLMWDFTDRLVREREANPDAEPNMLDEFIAAKNAGTIDEKELRYMIMTLFPAGYDTSKNALALILHYMIDRPDAWRRCAEDPGYCRRVTEEMFRYHSTVTQKRRVARAFDYDGVHIPVGTFLAFGTSTAGRDPRAFENAHVFDPDLDRDNRNLAFGRGVHMCLGQHLARAEIAEGIHLIAQRITNPRRTGEIAWRQFLGIGGLETLPIEFDPAPAVGESHA